jgi:hypothetical protein
VSESLPLRRLPVLAFFFCFVSVSRACACVSVLLLVGCERDKDAVTAALSGDLKGEKASRAADDGARLATAAAAAAVAEEEEKEEERVDCRCFGCWDEGAF